MTLAVAEALNPNERTNERTNEMLLRSLEIGPTIPFSRNTKAFSHNNISGNEILWLSNMRGHKRQSHKKLAGK